VEHLLTFIEKWFTSHTDILLLAGIAILAGRVCGNLFHRLNVPQIIGYIVVGVLIGQSGLRLINDSVIEAAEPINYFALGLIGFIIGGELKSEIFRRYGKQFVGIMIGEGIAAFVMVGTFVFLVVYLFTGDLKLSLALATVLGAISSATDPASTVQVLWEYKTRGALTTAVIAIVALDDALALGLYAFGTSIAGILTGQHGGSIVVAIGLAAYGLAASLLMGFLAGIAIRLVCRQTYERDVELTLAVAILMLVIGLSAALELDIILASMSMGLTLVNLEPKRSEKTFGVIKKFAPPVFVLFFVLVGARLRIDHLSHMAWAIVAVYVIFRSIGKVGGAYFTARWFGARQSVRRYLGLCLFTQGGVAIGLSIVASRKFSGEISSIVILVVAATTFIVQLIGPPFVKLGAKLAGEIGMNVTEEDLIKTYKVSDVLDTKVPVITSGMSLSEVIKLVNSTDKFHYPVVDTDNKLIGVITLDGIRKTFSTQELNDWLIALDIAEPVTVRISPEIELSEAIKKASQLDILHIPVTVSREDNSLVGILDCRAVRRSLAAELLSRQQQADRIQTASL